MDHVHSPLLKEKEAAQYIAMSVAYLKQARLNGVRESRTAGPAYIQLGRAIRYQRNDLDAWIAQHRCEPRMGNAEAAPALT
jgi:predicted DNA-binding transcriptional regulator AlpA